MQEILDERLPPKPIFKEGAIVGASFLGGPMAGAYMMAHNFRAFDEPNKAKMAMVYAGLITFILVVAAVFLPDDYNTVFRIFPIVCTVIISRIVHSYQGGKIERHIKQRGRTFPWWWAVVIALISVVIVVAAILIIALVTGKMSLFS